MNKCISLIWLKWQTVYLWYCRQASIVDNLKIQIMLYGVPRFPSFDVTSVDYSEAWWLYSSQSQSLLISPLSMWDENRLLGPVDLFVFFFFSIELPLSCALRFPWGKMSTAYWHCPDFWPAWVLLSLLTTQAKEYFPFGFPCTISLLLFRSFILQVPFQGLLCYLSTLKYSALSSSIYTLKRVSGTPMTSHTLIHRWLTNENKERQGEISSATFL